MYTKQDLLLQIKNMGIMPADTVLLHSSMKAIGEVSGGADTVLNVFMDYLSEGLLILPTHTWATMSEHHNEYDPAKEPACVGILPNLFRKREGVLRSLHPTHSVAVFGREKEKFIEGEEYRTTPCSPQGCYNRLREKDGKILLIGVGHERNTYIHCVEELLGVPERFTQKPVRFEIVMPGKHRKTSYMYLHYNPATEHISEAYPKLEHALYITGAAKKGSFGDASCILCDANAVYETMKKILSYQINCLLELDTIPEEWFIH